MQTSALETMAEMKRIWAAQMDLSPSLCDFVGMKGTEYIVRLGYPASSIINQERWAEGIRYYIMTKYSRPGATEQSIITHIFDYNKYCKSCKNRFHRLAEKNCHDKYYEEDKR